jgi:hypothetical protein
VRASEPPTKWRRFSLDSVDSVHAFDFISSSRAKE